MLTIYYCGHNVRVKREFDYPIPQAHPKDQVALARSIAKRVNAGEDIYLATNSDYMIKEFNILIGLWYTGLFNEWGYTRDEPLVCYDVVCYDGDSPCNINELLGIEIVSVTDVIHTQTNKKVAICEE
jgi:hypothetical protein